MQCSEAVEKIRIPVKYEDLSDGVTKYRMEDFPIMYPHGVIHFLFEKAKLKIPPEHIQQYWNHHSTFGEEWARNPQTHSMIPLGIFGDSARVTTQYGATHVLGIFLNVVLFRPASVRASRFLLFSIGEHELWHYHTLSVVLRTLTWSLNALFEGVHPTLDVHGKSLPPHLQKVAGTLITSTALCFCVTEIRGDWSWHKKLWRFWKTSWVGKKMCHWCRAESTGCWEGLYWNLTESSSWVDKEFTLEEFMEERLPPYGICI